MDETAGTLKPSIGEQLQRLIGHRAVPTLANLAAAVLFAWSLAHWTWALVPDLRPPSRATVAPPVVRSSESSLAAVVAANLFGRFTGSGSTLPTPALDVIPLTSLNMSLSGVVVAGATSYALLSVQGAPEAPVLLGDEIQAGTTLRAVYPDRVLIQRSGAIESVPLKDSEGVPVRIGTRSAPPAPVSALPVQPLGDGSYRIDRDQLTEQMQRPEFLSQAHIVPNASGGFLVREIQPGSVYERLGLRVGDVIRSVNGQTVNSIEDLMRLYQQFGATGLNNQINVEVVRAGRSEQLHYSVQ